MPSNSATLLPPPPHPRANLRQLHLAQTGEGKWELSYLTTHTVKAKMTENMSWPQVEALIRSLTAE